jgi:hypothetical protein
MKKDDDSDWNLEGGFTRIKIENRGNPGAAGLN